MKQSPQFRTPVPAVLALGAAAVIAALSASPARAAGEVKITPLGSHEGEFCRFDRALILEDPDGTRLLYDPGRTVAGGTDPRLGKIDAVLVSHMHGDHAGDRHLPAPGAGTCAKPDVSAKATPNTNAANIAIATGAKIVTGSEMPKFFAGKLKALGGDSKKSVLVRFGASTTVGGVTITTVPAAHSNMLDAAGLTAYAGPPTGYVLTFSNGLVAYLSGDTGVTAEQKTVVGDQYKARLVVMNIGDTYTTGPMEAAYVINSLIKPASVIASHANETGTEGGTVVGRKTLTFMKAAKVPVHIPLSGKTMSFDGSGTCVSGCCGPKLSC